jgi:serine/threonine protein phosphatase PrpC
METKSMSVPHSVIHAASYDEVEKHPATTEQPSKEKPGVKGMVSSMMPHRHRDTLFGATAARSRNSTLSHMPPDILLRRPGTDFSVEGQWGICICMVHVHRIAYLSLLLQFSCAVVERGFTSSGITFFRSVCIRPRSLTQKLVFVLLLQMGAIGKPFQKMRRRLTVSTGASEPENTEGHSEQAAKEMVPDKVIPAHTNKYQAAVRCAVTEYSGVSKKGHAPYNPRKKNQDALIMTDDPQTNSLVLCVLDGHGEHGDGVSQTFRDQLIPEMFNHPAWASDLKTAVGDAIAKVERNLLRNYRIDSEFSGTTLSMAVIRGNHVTGINIGDSRVILGKEEGGRMVAQDITFDHKPDTPAEKERILAHGGRVFAVEYDDGIDGPPRVWLGHMDIPGLAMSRSLGDVVAHSAGVISEPEFTEFELNPVTDKFLVVATDGLWEFVDNSETIEMVEAQATPTEAVDVLVTEAATRWMHEEQVIDDTTIIVANLFN